MSFFISAGQMACRHVLTILGKKTNYLQKYCHCSGTVSRRMADKYVFAYKYGSYQGENCIYYINKGGIKNPVGFLNILETLLYSFLECDIIREKLFERKKGEVK